MIRAGSETALLCSAWNQGRNFHPKSGEYQLSSPPWLNLQSLQIIVMCMYMSGQTSLHCTVHVLLEMATSCKINKNDPIWQWLRLRDEHTVEKFNRLRY